MRKSSLAVAFALVALPAAAAAPMPAVQWNDIHYPKLPEFHIPKPERVVLPNGLVLMLLEDHELPLVEGAVLVHAGSRLEPAAKIGLAALTGSVLRTGGTATRSGDQLDDQ